MATPLRSFLGGVGLTVTAHMFLRLNGTVFGISGFLHQTVRGSRDGAVALLGLLVGGMMAAAVNRDIAPSSTNPAMYLGLPQYLLSGILIGLGSKLANGCTSGYALCLVNHYVPTTLIFALQTYAMRYS